MKTITACLLFSACAFGQLPKIYTIGNTPECKTAAYKVLYVESRVGVPTGHVVYIACSASDYDSVLKEHRLTLAQSPYGFTDRKSITTYFNASAVLRSDPAVFNHDGRPLSSPNFGAFVIAHEIGHLVSGTPEEWQADTWAAQELQRRVKVSFEDFTHKN